MAVEALPRLWGVAKAEGAWPRTWGRGQGLSVEAKAVRANPKPNPKTVEGWPRPWGRGQGREGIAKA